MAEFHGAGGEGEQPLSGEGLQYRLHVPGLGGVLAVGQFGPGGAVGVVRAVAAGGGKPQEHLAGRGLPGRGEAVVGALGAGGDGAFDAAGAFIVGQGDGLPGAGPPSLVHSADLVSASQDQAERFVAVLEHAAATVAPEWAKTGRLCDANRLCNARPNARRSGATGSWPLPRLSPR